VTDLLASPATAPTTPARRVAMPVAVLASIGAGVVHAGVIGAHNDHVTLSRLFMACAVFQVGWGVAALVRPTRWVLWLGVLGNLVAVVAWGVSRIVGIGFVDGLQREAPEFADTACAVLGLLAVVGALAWLRLARRAPVDHGTVRAASFAVPALAVALLAVPALVKGSTHGHGHTPQAVAPKPYDPTQPVDLGGVPGVSAKQQARAEKLVRDTLRDLPHFADPATAQAEGYRSIGDALTGFEHFLKTSIIEDNAVLDAKAPESLVYQVTPAGKTLVSAMYILPSRYTLANAPDIGGPLTQWHIHDNLCFLAGADGTAGRVVGLTRADGTCAFGQKFTPLPMIHVWITPHGCGPFAALEGVGAGQVLPGQTRLCDTAHGSH
jgi:hypothetical protein